MLASEALREATAEAHRKLESTDFARQLEDGSVGRQTYVDYLRAIAVLVANMRTTIRRRGATDLDGVVPTLDDWAERIDADIRAIAADDATANERAQTVVLGFVQKVFEHFDREKDWLYGVLYVLYGSHNGSRSLADAISRGLRLEGDAGTSYFRATRSPNAVWRRFKAFVDERLTSEEQLRSAEAGAVETFECFAQVFSALEGESSRGVKASAVNPEAGDHPVPEDSQLAELAAEVGRACHLAFGYLCRRYGSRGEAFARSDGVWLVTLVEMPEHLAQRRVDWLARLLSGRGIPSLCLEYYLERLHHALSETRALDESQLSRLLALSDRVGASRRAAVSDEVWTSIVTTPVPALDPLGAPTLVSAIIDQRSGLATCADSISRWIESTPSLEGRQRQELLAILQLPGVAPA